MNIERDSWLVRRGVVAAVSLGILLLAGWANSRLVAPSWQEIESRQPELELADLEGGLGQGMMLGLFGGFRTLMADVVFIAAYLSWEERDRGRTETLQRLATTIDPQVWYFWQSGAQVMAYDFPHWRYDLYGGAHRINRAQKERIDREEAKRALAYLEEAERYFPGGYEIPLEKGRIHLFKRNDREQAAPLFLEAWQRGGPDYLGRIYAENLEGMGRLREAYDFLTQTYYPTLPPFDPAQNEYNRAIALERLRELEDDLEMPPAERFPSPDWEEHPLPGNPSP